MKMRITNVYLYINDDGWICRWLEEAMNFFVVVGKPSNVNKLSYCSLRCGTRQWFQIAHLYSMRFLQAMEYKWNRKKPYNEIYAWIHTALSVQTIEKPTSDDEFSRLFVCLQRFPFRSGLWRWPPAPLVCWNLKVFIWDWDYVLGIRWKLFCLEIRQWPIESVIKSDTISRFLNVATVSAKLGEWRSRVYVGYFTHSGVQKENGKS